jgi:uncharacterized protein YdhG (YjbR/CyaY superfamily)
MPTVSIDDYLAAATSEAAVVISELRTLIHQVVPDVVESIAYGMPTFTAPGRHRFHLGAWAQHVGVYPVHPAPEPLETRLAPFRAAKDTVQLPLDRPLDEKLAQQLVTFLLTRPN